METQLSARERNTLLELGDRGAGGNFDQMALSKLFVLGLVEVRSGDRRLILTTEGRQVYSQMVAVRRGASRDGRSSRSQ